MASETEIKPAHTPRDVNHQFLDYAGHEFCHECGVSLRGKRTELEREMLVALEEVVSAIHDGFLRYAAGDQAAIRSNMISATVKQAEAAIRKAKGEQ